MALSDTSVEKDAKIFVTGHCGMVGTAVLTLLRKQGYQNLITATRAECDLTNQEQVTGFCVRHKPEYVFLPAAKVAGIHGNNEYPAAAIYENIMIAANMIHAAWQHGVKRLLFFGSSCIYPKFAKQPMGEDQLLASHLEITNKPYAIAKIAGLNLCEAYNRQYDTDFRSIMPTNVYGPGDNYHPQNSHVLAALMLKLHEANKRGDKEVVLWGSGTPLREFIHTDDLADAALYVMCQPREKVQNKDRIDEHINIGTGDELPILELAKLIKEIIGYSGRVEWDTQMPDGTPRKRLDLTRLYRLGWKPAYCATRWSAPNIRMVCSERKQP